MGELGKLGEEYSEFFVLFLQLSGKSGIISKLNLKGILKNISNSNEFSSLSFLFKHHSCYPSEAVNLHILNILSDLVGDGDIFEHLSCREETSARNISLNQSVVPSLSQMALAVVPKNLRNLNLLRDWSL